MIIETKTRVRCDNCGTVTERARDHTVDDGWRNELPSLYNNALAFSYIGTPTDYCPACIKAVDDAIAGALAARKAAASQ